MRHITNHAAPAIDLRGIGDTSWQSRGACHGMDPMTADAVFFPLPRDHEAIAEAKEMCSICPVQRDCLNYALENDLREGVWGGLTEAERRPWHRGLPQRLDYKRVKAFFDGRDVHLTEVERQVVIDHAYVRDWRPDRLAAALQISHKHARDLLRQAANRVFDRDRTYGVPKLRKKRVKAAPKTGGPPPVMVAVRQPVSQHVSLPSLRAPLEKVLSVTARARPKRREDANGTTAGGRPVVAGEVLVAPQVRGSDLRDLEQVG
ncbi:WhiB family transcriptional regulator [Streptomyces sp. NPDC006285]|uniref:WhiB family transcriptional regulator n=1 Tax=Streptomyces sp. NPDC006285 TaxID=3364742 RepID=UPI00368C6CF7